MNAAGTVTARPPLVPQADPLPVATYRGLPD
jgi:hypothetical protein